ncbi:hypothetical protein [Sediminibacillus halophilus]|uniref:hypothetical protein n=1 Tax=Sediminibacillus halophilus TaxID=482461 RepID=UPI000943EC10|nr:hypothetical protein [Sediminibacillus halophilus]
MEKGKRNITGEVDSLAGTVAWEFKETRKAMEKPLFDLELSAEDMAKSQMNTGVRTFFDPDEKK